MCSKTLNLKKSGELNLAEHLTFILCPKSKFCGALTSNIHEALNLVKLFFGNLRALNLALHKFLSYSISAFQCSVVCLVFSPFFKAEQYDNIYLLFVELRPFLPIKDYNR
jgi:hypothetical protein